MPSRLRATLAGFAAMVVVAGCANTATRPATPTAGPQPLVVTPVPVRVEPRPPTAGPPLDLTDLVALGPSRLVVSAVDFGDDVLPRHSRIVETRDSGATWRELWRGEHLEVDSLARRPDGALVAFAQRYAFDGDVARSWRLLSRDGGHTWTRRRVAPIATGNGPGFAVGVTFVTDRVGAATLGPTGGGGVPVLLTTRDGGLTWIRLAGPDREVAFASARVAVGIGPYPERRGSFGGLLRSTDRGSHWRPIPGTRGVNGAIAFSSPTHGLAAGVLPYYEDDPPASATLRVTDDAGATWSRRVARYEDSRHPGVDGPVPRFPITDLVSAGRDRWWAVTADCTHAPIGCVGDLLRSDDDGRHWRVAGFAVDVVAGGPDSAVEVPASDDIVSPTESGMLRFTHDAGRTWTKRFTRGRVHRLDVRIEPRDRSLVLDTVVGRFRSVDAGRTWSEGGSADDRTSVELADRWPVVRTTVGRARRSAALPIAPGTRPAGDGARWRFQFLDDRRILLLVDHVGVFRSDDGGGSWHALGRLDASVLESGSFDASPDGRTLVVTAFDGPDGPALLSRDGGSTFAELRLPPGLACSSAAAVDRTVVLGCASDRTLGRDDVIAVSDDLGATFRFTRPRREVGVVRALDASTFVGSDDRDTIAISRDAGRSWIAVRPDLPGGG